MVDFYCNICHESYENSDEIYSTRCGHVFHHQCVTNWLKRSSTCSECRADCSSSNITKLFIPSREIKQRIVSDSNFIQPVNDSKKNPKMIKGDSQCKFFQKLHEMQIIGDSLGRELDSLRNENVNLRKKLHETNERMKLNEKKQNIDLVAKNKMIEELNRELNAKTLQLQKEQRNSEMLIAEKRKLQQLLESSKQRTTR